MIRTIATMCQRNLKKTEAQRKSWSECEINENIMSPTWAKSCPLLSLTIPGITVDVVASEAHSEPLKQVESFAKCCVIRGTLSLGVTVSIDAGGGPVRHCILRFHNLDLHYLATATPKQISPGWGVCLHEFHLDRSFITPNFLAWWMSAIVFVKIFRDAIFIPRGGDTGGNWSEEREWEQNEMLVTKTALKF